MMRRARLPRFSGYSQQVRELYLPDPGLTGVLRPHSR